MRLNAGFSLIEVLVSVVILSIGLLGVAALQMSGMQYSQGAYQQSQASGMIADLIDRMRANPGIGDNDVRAIYTFNTASSAPGDPDDCVASGCTATQLAEYDVWEWWQGIQERLGPASDARVTTAGGGDFRIIVTWSDVAERNASGGDASRTMTTDVEL